ncbi:MAG: (Fe-S)-binding protein [Fimbriimonas sp.]
MARRVRLMLTCLCDAYFGEVGIATVRVLEAAGCEVVFDANQTCCGQPPFNSGDWPAARQVANHCRQTLFSGEQLPVITPSGSCAAMVREGYPLIFADDSHLPCFEVGEFLVKELGIQSWPPEGHPAKQKELKVAFHRACHGRGIGLKDEQETLLGSIPGVQLLPFEQAEQCCGFGGAFSANHPMISAQVGLEKIRNIQASGAEVIASGDMGCLMHLRGLIQRQNLALRTVHYVELLAEALGQEVAV